MTRSRCCLRAPATHRLPGRRVRRLRLAQRLPELAKRRGSQDHPLLLIVQGEAVSQQRGALLAQVAAQLPLWEPKPSRPEKMSKV